MGREIKVPSDWNAEVQKNIDRIAFTFQSQTDEMIARRIYERLLELKELCVDGFEQDPVGAEQTYRLRAELDDLIVRAQKELDTQGLI